MLTDVYHDAETSVYNAPALCIPAISGLTVPGNVAPDTGAPGQVVYLHLTSYGGINAEQINEVTTLPILTVPGLSYGGQFAAYAPLVLPRITLEGYIDTPCTQSGEYFLPNVHDSGGIKYMYGEIIAMMMEGRANVGAGGEWQRLDPLWFRDPWGRVYNTPRILDFTGTYVEGVPERTQFSMALKV